MTPLKANEAARIALVNAKWNCERAHVETDVLECLLVTAEREAKLREALNNMADLWLTVGGTEDNPVYADAVAALEQKGGASDDT